MSEVQETLDERGARYGDFSDHAHVSDAFMRVVVDSVTPCKGFTNWGELDAVKKQAIVFITDKLARILTGDPEYRDNWHDIQGYAKLAEDRCKDGDADKQMGFEDLHDVKVATKGEYCATMHRRDYPNGCDHTGCWVCRPLHEGAATP